MCTCGELTPAPLQVLEAGYRCRLHHSGHHIPSARDIFSRFPARPPRYRYCIACRLLKSLSLFITNSTCQGAAAAAEFSAHERRVFPRAKKRGSSSRPRHPATRRSCFTEAPPRSGQRQGFRAWLRLSVPLPHHLTFSAWSPPAIEDFKVRLGNFVVCKNCFQIPVDWEMIVKDMVRARLAELD